MSLTLSLQECSQVLLNLSKMSYKIKSFHNSLSLKMSSKDLWQNFTYVDVQKEE